jgi:predicted RNase H-like HicB family nuclease
MRDVTFIVHIEQAEEVGFIAYFPALPGCHTQGDTFDEVVAMAKDVLVGYLRTLREHGEPIPEEGAQSKHVGFEFPVSASVLQ